MSPGTSGKSSALVIFIINIKIFPFIYLLRKEKKNPAIYKTQFILSLGRHLKLSANFFS